MLTKNELNAVKIAKQKGTRFEKWLLNNILNVYPQGFGSELITKIIAKKYMEG